MNQKRPTVQIQTYQFISGDGTPGEFGGAIRYLRDLGSLFRDLGFAVRYVQKGNRRFSVPYEDWAEVIGIPSPRGVWGDPIFARRAYELAGDAAIVCYGTMDDSFPWVHPRSFAIQHGVWWDYSMSFMKRRVQYHRVRNVSERVRFVLCVDTNFINWYRLMWPSESSVLNKLHYVPNYADTTLFNAYGEPSDPPLLLFPRRFVRKRGGELFLAMCERLRSMGIPFQAAMVGSGVEEERLRREISRSSLAEITHISSADFVSIATFYQKAFLTFVPTLWSEGTSLSAIEAIVSGCPVVTSDVGGLGNVVIPGFNGEICPPDVDAFTETTLKLLRNNDYRERLAANCLQMRESLSKDRWQQRVISLLQRYFPDIMHTAYKYSI